MDDELSRPYQRIAAAEEQIERGSLLDYYVSLYKQKYRSEPIFPISAVTQTQIKDLQRIMRHRSRDAITAYFSMNDEWFSRQQYSLECLLKNLSKINVQIDKNSGERKLKGKLRIPFYCDACWQPFDLICDMAFDYINELVRCDACKAKNAPLKKVSAEEKKKTLGTIGYAFKEVPK